MKLFNVCKRSNNKTELIGEIIEEDINIVLYKCRIKEIDNEKFINWAKNRLPDIMRIIEINRYYKKNKLKRIPGVIYAWEKDNKFHIYDGIHRFLAAKHRKKDMTFLLQVRKTKNEKEIIDECFYLNKIQFTI